MSESLSRERATAVAVVGSGPAGLAAAFRLQQAGRRVRMFEQNDYVGGRMKTIRRNGFMIEEGAALMPTTYKNLLAIADEAGLGSEVVPGGTVFAFPWRGGEQYIDCAHMVRTGARFQMLSLRSKALMLRLAQDCYRHLDAIRSGDLSRLAAQDDGESAADYTRRRLNEEILENVVNPALRGIAGDTPDRLSKLDLFYTFNLFLGGMRPLTFRNGISTFTEGLAARFDVSLSTRVTMVAEDDHYVAVTFAAGGEERTERFAGCVLAIPPAAAAAAHPGLDDLRADFLRAAKSTPVVNVTAALRRAPDGVDWTYMPIPQRAHPDLLLIALFHHYGPGRAPEGKGLLGVYPTPELSAQLWDQPDEACAREVLARVEQVVPGLISDLEFTHVNKWDPLLYVSWPGYYRKLAEFQRIGAGHDRRVRLAGDYFTVSSMNSAVASGETAARALNAHLTNHTAARATPMRAAATTTR